MSETTLTKIPCSQLRGVGPKLATLLAEAGLRSFSDLLYHLPYRYEDRRQLTAISELQANAWGVIQGKVTAVTPARTQAKGFLCRIADSSGELSLRFFHRQPYLTRSFSPGQWVRCYGQATRHQGLQMVHPDYELLTDPNAPLEQGLRPVYRLPAGIGQKKFNDLIEQVLPWLEQLGIQSIIPSEQAQIWQLPTIQAALHFIHRPPLTQSVGTLADWQHPMQQRLILEELLRARLQLLQSRDAIQRTRSHPCPVTGPLKQAGLAAVPFKLTAAQQRVIAEIGEELAQPWPMQRLLQGDVGSGKTLVALAACLQVIEAGLQVAIMAPTELLADQHVAFFKRMLEPLGITVASLFGRDSASQRQRVLTQLVQADIQCIIGTHSLFQQQVQFAALGLVIIDEQHRFGVAQRRALYDKGRFPGGAPHLLTISATPIPRSLAKVYYADLDVSVLDELPLGRQAITTVALAKSKRQQVIDKIKPRLASGEQAFWVTTRIEEDETSNRAAAEALYAQLQAALPDQKIGLAHGQLPSEEKQSQMKAFANGELAILVATTVIEVGVDVPNATMMIIEDPERLGLAQLHQLRGRVGRGTQAGYCLLLHDSPLTEPARDRLAALRASQDGFELAQMDLEQRGPGDLLGAQQSGLPNFRFVDLKRDRVLLDRVKEYAAILQENMLREQQVAD